MFEQRAPSHTPATAPGEWPGETVIMDWIAAWQPVREDVLQLMESYRVADAGHDISRFLPLIDEVDDAIRLLQHRVGWLRSYLGHTVDEPIDRP